MTLTDRHERASEFMLPERTWLLGLVICCSAALAGCSGGKTPTTNNQTPVANDFRQFAARWIAAKFPEAPIMKESTSKQSPMFRRVRNLVLESKSDVKGAESTNGHPVATIECRVDAATTFEHTTREEAERDNQFRPDRPYNYRFTFHFDGQDWVLSDATTDNPAGPPK